MNKLISNDIKMDFNDVLISPTHSYLQSRSEVDLTSEFLYKILGIRTTGLIAANMDGVGTMSMASVLKKYDCLTALHKHYSIDTLVEHFTNVNSSHSFYSMGITSSDLEKFGKVYSTVKNNLPYSTFKLMIDCANGYMESFIDFCKLIKTQYPEVFVMAGNVVDSCGAINLMQRGNVDSVKIGIGSGAVCLTRTQTGIGYPQFSAMIDTLKDLSTHYIFHDKKAPRSVCSDGGCTNPGDVAKAFATGSDFVMIGSILSGTDESEQQLIEIDGKQFIEFYGMSSKTANNKHFGGLKDYRSSEGRTTLVPYKGSAENIIKDILGGLRSACTYTNSKHIDYFKSNAQFIRVNNILNKSMEKHSIGN